MKTSKCKICEQHLPLENFSIDKTMTSGVYYICRKCNKAKYRIKKPFVDNTLIPLDGELWKDIIGYADYMISNFGRVYIKDKTTIRTAKNGNKSEYFVQGRLKTINLSKHPKADYLQTNLAKGNEKLKLVKVHRLVAEHFVHNPNNKPHVNHLDANKLNNNYTNLEWCTHLENVRHAIDLGLKPPALNGEECNFSKLTEKEVLEIRKIGRSLFLRQIAKKYNISTTNVSDIINGKIWKHLL